MKGKFFWVIALFSVFAITLTSCNEYKDSGKGYKYKYLAKGDGEALQWDEWIMLDVYYYKGSDSLFMSSKNSGRPVVFKWDTVSYNKSGDFHKSLENYVPGDSIEVVTTAKWFYDDVKGRLPFFFQDDDPMTIRIQVKDKFSDRDAVTAYFEELKEIRNEEEDQMIQNYLSENNLEAQKTESGIYYIVEEQGSDLSPVAGDSITVHYNGTLLDGTKFDASYDRDEPFKFVVGRRQVIAGWDEGLQLFGEGGKGTLIIPSRLAYGERQRSEVIKANSILIFEVELLKVKKG